APGDFNLDHHVDAGDVPAMLAAMANLSGFQTDHSLTDDVMHTLEDVNGDGTVNNADIQYLINLLKNGGGDNSVVPEPSWLGLVGLGAGLLMLRRRAGRCPR